MVLELLFLLLYAQASINSFVIHNSLDYNTQLNIRNNLTPSSIFTNHFNNSNSNLIFIGRLTKVKKLDLLLDAIKILKDKGCEYNITFIGNGSEKEFLQKRICELELDNNVWLYGTCYDEIINAELIYNADLCVAPGNVGLTAMHTMVFGTPVLTHGDFKWQMPEFEAIIPNKTGSFFEKDNVNDLADKIELWFKNNKNKRDIVRKFCYDEIDTSWNPYFQLKVLKDNVKF